MNSWNKVTIKIVISNSKIRISPGDKSITVKWRRKPRGLNKELWCSLFITVQSNLCTCEYSRNWKKSDEKLECPSDSRVIVTRFCAFAHSVSRFWNLIRAFVCGPNTSQEACKYFFCCRQVRLAAFRVFGAFKFARQNLCNLSTQSVGTKKLTNLMFVDYREIPWLSPNMFLIKSNPDLRVF